MATLPHQLLIRSAAVRQTPATVNHLVRLLSTHGGAECKPPYGYSSNVNVERLRNRDKQFFTPGPLDPEIQDYKDFRIEEKKLFTSGPLKVSESVKEAMMLDVGSRDPQFLKSVQFVRDKIMEISGLPEDDYSTILLSTNGATCMESVLQTAVPREGGKVLVLENGSDGRLIADICHRAQYQTHVISFPVDSVISVDKIRSVLERDDAFTHVVMVHCEPSTGIINPIEEIGKLLFFYNPRMMFIVDGGMSFGAVSMDIEAAHVDFFTGNSYTCLESVPGICFVLVKNTILHACAGTCPSLTLDLVSYWEDQVKTGHLSYTPNTHALLALARALIEFEEEGGVEGRSRRYKKNSQVLREGMAKLGFRESSAGLSGYMVNTFHSPAHPDYNFHTFYTKLYEKGVLIYPGRGRTDCFRVSTIGKVNPHDVRYLLRQVEDVCNEMGIRTPLQE